MQKELTITLDEQVYEELCQEVGAKKISQFIEALVRPHVIKQNLEEGYKQMSQDHQREEDALKWSGVIADASNT